MLISESIDKYLNTLGMYIFAQNLDQQYLGFITTSQIESESIINEIGSYGSSVSSTSIYNSISQYGSTVGTYSAFNNLSSNPPIIYSYSSVTDEFTAQYYLTKNYLRTPYIDPEFLKFLLLVNFEFDLEVPDPLLVDVKFLNHKSFPNTEPHFEKINSSIKILSYSKSGLVFVVRGVDGKKIYMEKLQPISSSIVFLSHIQNGLYIGILYERGKVVFKDEIYLR